MEMICLCFSPWIIPGRQLFVLLTSDNPSRHHVQSVHFGKIIRFFEMVRAALKDPVIGRNSRLLSPFRKIKIFSFLQSVSKTVSLLFIPLQPRLVCKNFSEH